MLFFIRIDNENIIKAYMYDKFLSYNSTIVSQSILKENFTAVPQSIMLAFLLENVGLVKSTHDYKR